MLDKNNDNKNNRNYYDCIYFGYYCPNYHILWEINYLIVDYYY